MSIIVCPHRLCNSTYIMPRSMKSNANTIFELDQCLFHHDLPIELRWIIRLYHCVQLFDHNIHDAVNDWVLNRSHALIKYGHISDWHTHRITDMSKLFWPYARNNHPLWEKLTIGLKQFNDNIENWDVSNVINMKCMFYQASLFNQPLEAWDVSNVTNMSYMFDSAKAFNRPLNKWNVSNVTEMTSMFNFAASFNQPLDQWDMISVVCTAFMFTYAHVFNQPLESWNVVNVTNMAAMFFLSRSFNQPLNSWNVSKVTMIDYMFSGAKKFNQPLDKWDVSNVTTMREMFHQTSAFNQDLNSWQLNKSSPPNTMNMFRGAIAFDIGRNAKWYL